ncbi:hypothetical protein B0H14DRAFT_3605367 [Mycena olivaceomarginata]|nr:hypothetical protein B0H14DRAFT_3605367 [Mycena olivaceomarginata]
MDAKKEGFDKSNWIDQGKLWASAPPMVRNAANEAFSMPQHMEDLLPSSYLPIAQMLEFGLPLQILRSQHHFLPSEALRLRVRRLPIPDTKTVHKLLATSRQSWSDGTQSIIYSHLGGDVNHFPLWVLTYWGAVVDIKRDASGPWRNSLAEEASLMLSMAPWGRPKPPGFSNSEPFHTLWRFVGPHWLTDSQMDDMLELLHYKISCNPDLIQKTRIWGTVLASKIVDAYRAADTTAYGTAPDLRWLRDLGDDIVENGAALVTSSHLGDVANEAHWVALIFGMTQPGGIIRYGDSLGAPIPAERWLHK